MVPAGYQSLHHVDYPFTYFLRYKHVAKQVPLKLRKTEFKAVQQPLTRTTGFWAIKMSLIPSLLPCYGSHGNSAWAQRVNWGKKPDNSPLLALRNRTKKGLILWVHNTHSHKEEGTQVSSQRGEDGGFPRSCWTDRTCHGLSTSVSHVGLLNAVTATGCRQTSILPGHHSLTTRYPRQPHGRSRVAFSYWQSQAASEPQAGITSIITQQNWCF